MLQVYIFSLPRLISDKEITKKSGYLDMMEPYTELIVDKDLTLCCDPPGKGGSSQTLPLEFTKTNEIAKTPILVGQVIWRLKVFMFIANEVSINMLSYIDGILQICAAIPNMQSSIYG